MVGWTRIKLGRLAWLLESAPERLRWRWAGTGVVSPRGVRWEYRLARGVWIRREKEAQKATSEKPNGNPTSNWVNPTVTQP